MYNEQQLDDSSDSSARSFDVDELANVDKNLPLTEMRRGSSDGYEGLRSSQHSIHSAIRSRSESASYTKTRMRRSGAVNRMNNGVLASKPLNPKRASVDSSLSASDSAIDVKNLQFTLRSTGSDVSRSLTSSIHESIQESIHNDNQEQQQYNQLSPPRPSLPRIESKNLSVSYVSQLNNNGNDNNKNNGDKEQTQQQQQPFFTRCCAGWQYVLACSPMKRYRKRSSAIATQENQYFIPPPEENTTFIESILYIMNGYGQDFIVWMYQASFFAVLIMCLTAYYALVLSFAGVLVAMERASEGQCKLAADSLMISESMFELAFELSWTTFTTVGYGQVAPSGEDCYHMRIACSIFAFMGLLFNSLSAAVFFSKLERVLTKASVTFSSSLCLQFSTIGADRGASVDSYRHLEFGLRSVKSDIVPYPFLEFRIVNDHANHASRAVRNASCTALVSISGKHAELISDEVQQSSELYKEIVTKSFSVESEKERPSVNTDTYNLASFRQASSRTLSLFSTSRAATKSNAFDQDDAPEEEKANAHVEIVPSRRARSSARAKRADMIGLTDSIKQTAIIVQENDNNKGQDSTPEGRVYFPLELEPSTNPYMSKVWYVRHTLNEKSPLLTYSVRERLKRDGAWDAERDTYADIISSLVDFHKISVTFKGTSSASNSLLFTQKVYTREDIYVGWRFGPLFFEKKGWKWLPRCFQPKKHHPATNNFDNGDTNGLVLDTRLIHDIQPQSGGGQEPIGE